MTPRLPIDPDLAEALIDGVFWPAWRGVNHALDMHEPAVLRGAVRRVGAVALWAELLGVDLLTDDEWPASYVEHYHRGYRDERVRVGELLNGRAA